MTYHIGQQVPFDIHPDDRSLCIPGTPRWHALIVPVMGEDAAEAWLKQHRVYGFHPIKRRQVTIRGKRIIRESRYLPGYVFARFPGPVIWHRVFSRPFVFDTVRMASGTPGILRRDALRQIHAMRRVDETRMGSIAKHRAQLKEAMRVRPGDTVDVMGGPLEGTVFEVITIRAGEAVVRLKIFGEDREISISPDLLRKRVAA